LGLTTSLSLQPFSSHRPLPTPLVNDVIVCELTSTKLRLPLMSLCFSVDWLTSLLILFVFPRGESFLSLSLPLPSPGEGYLYGDVASESLRLEAATRCSIYAGESHSSHTSLIDRLISSLDRNRLQLHSLCDLLCSRDLKEDEDTTRGSFITSFMMTGWSCRVVCDTEDKDRISLPHQ
jgi:hypothetical protein